MSAPDPELAARIASRVEALRTRIAAAARAAGREPGSITIVAATKTRTLDELAAVLAAEIGDLGENRVQEWLDKRAHLPDARWHLIGPLQRNKAGKVAGQVALVHALDDPGVAEALDRRAAEIGAIQPVLLQVNTSGEASKAGLAPEDAEDAARRVAALGSLELRGWCTVASIADPAGCFARLAALRDRLRAAHPGAVELSMGMSDDLEAAIAHGATMVRPGTALFGPRVPMP